MNLDSYDTEEQTHNRTKKNFRRIRNCNKNACFEKSRLPDDTEKKTSFAFSNQ